MKKKFVAFIRRPFIDCMLMGLWVPFLGALAGMVTYVYQGLLLAGAVVAVSLSETPQRMRHITDRAEDLIMGANAFLFDIALATTICYVIVVLMNCVACRLGPPFYYPPR